MSRRAARIDENQPEIVEHFRKLGCSVTPTHAVGTGFPDLVVGKFGVNVLVEVKNPDKVPSKRRLTPDQVEFHLDWRGQIFIVESFDDVVKVAEWLLIRGINGTNTV